MNNKNKQFSLVLSLTTAILLVSAGSASASDIEVSKVVEQTNLARSAYGLKALKIDSNLAHAANQKTVNMISRNYFEHYALGVTPWMIMNNAGYDYQIAGENLAMDFNTTEGMIGAWMNSPLHRQNILNSNYEDIGVGVVKGVFTDKTGQTHETIMVTQMFGKKKTIIGSITSKIISRVLGIF